MHRLLSYMPVHLVDSSLISEKDLHPLIFWIMHTWLNNYTSYYSIIYLPLRLYTFPFHNRSDITEKQNTTHQSIKQKLRTHNRTPLAGHHIYQNSIVKFRAVSIICCLRDFLGTMLAIKTNCALFKSMLHFVWLIRSSIELYDYALGNL